MFLVGIFSWWYGSGWRTRVHLIKTRLVASADYFSVGMLAATLFAPFRQISAGKVEGSIGDILHAFVDRSISRVVGFVVRSFMIIFGATAIFLQTMYGIIILIFWPVIPILPVIGLVLMVTGWIPQWTN